MSSRDGQALALPTVAPTESSRSGVSWAAVFAGALAAAVLSLLLFMLGIGLGLSSLSVWSGRGADGETVGWAAIVWLAFTQLASAGIGGYLAGRLRTGWTGIHSDEVHFRDTAHGFLAWAFATVLMFSLMGSVAAAAISGTAKTAGAVASTAAGSVANAVGGASSAAISGAVGADVGRNAGASGPNQGMDYWIQGLFRRNSSGAQQEQTTSEAKATAQQIQSAADDAREASVIFAQALRSGNLPEEDARYLGQLVASRTDLSTDEATAKVQRAFGQLQQQIEEAKQKAAAAEQKAKETAEAARKATAYSLLWAFVALLVGAFVGSLAATWGGRQRDSSLVSA